MKIYIVRHGETNLNAKGVMQGRLNEPLNENGRNIAHITGKAIEGIHFDYCICSPLDRAQETAKIILCESKNDIPIETDARLIEMNFGDLEGGYIEQMGDEGQKFYLDPFHFIGFPNGETIQELCARTKDFLKELIAKDDGKTYLVSTHGTAMRAMANCVSDDQSDFWLGHIPYNCSFTIVEAEGGKAKIVEVEEVFYDLSLVNDGFKK